MLPEVYRAPESVDLQDAMTLVGPAAVEILTGLQLACAAVETLADELDAVTRERSALVARIESRCVPGIKSLPVADDRDLEAHHGLRRPPGTEGARPRNEEAAERRGEREERQGCPACRHCGTNTRGRLFSADR